MRPLAVGAMVEADFWPECVRVVVLECKRVQGRGAEELSSENLGYDLRSTAPGGAVRYIKVKARARTGAIALTPNEWLMAQRPGGEYWLYVVEHAATAAELSVVQDPAAKLHPDEVIEVVRYVVRTGKKGASLGRTDDA